MTLYSYFIHYITFSLTCGLRTIYLINLKNLIWVDIVKCQVKFCILLEFLHIILFLTIFASTGGPHEISRRAACDPRAADWTALLYSIDVKETLTPRIKRIELPLISFWMYVCVWNVLEIFTHIKAVIWVPTEILHPPIHPSIYTEYWMHWACVPNRVSITNKNDKIFL